MIFAPFLVMLSLGLAEDVQKVELYRFSDRVTVREGGTGKETVLFYDKKMILMDKEDEVVQGSQAISECRFEEDSRVRFFSRAVYRFGELSAEKKVIRIFNFTRILVKANDGLTLLMPGGTRVFLSNCDCYLEREGHVIHIRNAGPQEVGLSGHLVIEANRLLPAGNTISLPLFDPSLKDEAEPIVVREVAGMIVKSTGGYCFEEMPGQIEVSRPGPEDGTACVGGVTVFLDPGQRVVFRLP